MLHDTPVKYEDFLTTTTPEELRIVVKYLLLEIDSLKREHKIEIEELNKWEGD